MQTFKKILVSIILLLLFIFIFTNPYLSSHNIDSLAYVVALGLDVGETNNLKLSLQLYKPTESSGSSSGSSQSSNSLINSVDCSSISSGINLFNSYISKQISLSHCKVIVISEELAKQGISKYLYTLVNNVQIGSDCNIIISKSDSYSFLENSKPTVEKLIARYYESAPMSSLYTGFTEDVTLGDFFSDYTDSFKQPHAILGSINTSQTQDNIISSNNAKTNTSSSTASITDNTNYENDNKDSDYIAGETPITSENNIESMGLAVFYSDKLVGELNALETLCHMIVVNKIQTAEIQISSPVNLNEKIDISLKQNLAPKISLKIINNTPYIKINLNINARIRSMDENSEHLNEDNILKIEESVNKYLEENISAYLYKTAKQFNSDIVGFGKYAVGYFKTLDEWQDYNWLYNYRNSFFDVTVNSDIKSTYLLIDN